MKYRIEYADETLVEIEIDKEKALPIIIEMVEFWYNHEKILNKYDGNYIYAWLHYLAKFVWAERSLPTNNDEGWISMTDENEYGIKILEWSYPTFDNNQLDISAVIS